MGKFQRKMERFRSSKKGSNHCSIGGFARNAYRLTWLSLIIVIVGCTSLKKASVVTTAAGVGAVVGSATSGGVIAPVAGAMMGAFAGDVTTEVLSSPAQDSCIQQPLGFFGLLEKLIEVGGWLLIIVLIAPMVLGWLLPGPLERKQKR